MRKKNRESGSKDIGIFLHYIPDDEMDVANFLENFNRKIFCHV